MKLYDMNHPLTYLIVAAVIGVIGFFLKMKFDSREKIESIKKDQDKIYQWLMSEFREEKDFEYRTTKAISSGTHLSEDRVREVAIADQRIHKSTGTKNDLWTVKGKPLV